MLFCERTEEYSCFRKTSQPKENREEQVSCGQISCLHENLPTRMYEGSAKRAKMSCAAAKSAESAVLRMARSEQ